MRPVADELKVDRGLYIAATGMLTSMTRQDVIASNLANVNTAGFKADRVVNETFSSLFLQNLENGRPLGNLNMGTRVAGIVTDFSQGALRPSDNKLDVALSGDGFFVVQTPQGIAYTRAGQLTRTADGFLVTQKGETVLGTNNERLFVGAGDPQIDRDGNVRTSEGNLSGQLAIATLDIEQARKVGDNLWIGAETGRQPANTSVRQGMFEASGVNSVKEMVEMISTLRSYETSQRVIQSIDGTLDRAVNSVGSLNG